MRNSTSRLVAALLGLGLALSAARSVAAEDLSNVDLNGHWYILIHYKDDRSEDKSITKFKDALWSIEQSGNKMQITSYPYVFFSEADELIRRSNMMNHVAWMPDERIWGEIRESVSTSERGSKVKTLRGSHSESFSTSSDGGGLGMNTLTFSQDWTVSFEPERIKVSITDSLSGSGGLEGMDETIVYQLTERVSEDEFRGRYDDATRHGKLWMVRSKQRVGQQKKDAKKAEAEAERRRSALEEWMERSPN